jgi:hypothetical protein
MSRGIGIQANWDKEAKVWTVTSHGVPGLVIEAENWAEVIIEIELVLPDLIELSGQPI